MRVQDGDPRVHASSKILESEEPMLRLGRVVERHAAQMEHRDNPRRAAQRRSYPYQH